METLDVNEHRFASVISDINKELQTKGYLSEDEMVGSSMAVEMSCPVPKAKVQLRQLMSEMMHQIDIWNMIEAVRENGLHVLEPGAELEAERLEHVLSTAFSQLNKRVPLSQAVPVDRCVALTTNWLMSAYDRESTGHIRAFAVKVALAHLSSGKLVDKLRCKEEW
ncbi:dystrobrevin [Elysia marginata]|uniref:Dystrobrevin n=1 Tax=Elysia marginata TaxID=1093978 RepID=A0AAV4EVU6_9GAST|nr:dystrobrevin [Elysia marginata]